MDEILVTLLSNAPNLIIAIWVINRDQQMVAKFMEMQKWMIEQLMALHPPQDDASAGRQMPSSTNLGNPPPD